MNDMRVRRAGCLARHQRYSLSQGASAFVDWRTYAASSFVVCSVTVYGLDGLGAFAVLERKHSFVALGGVPLVCCFGVCYYATIGPIETQQNARGPRGAPVRGGPLGTLARSLSYSHI